MYYNGLCFIQLAVVLLACTAFVFPLAYAETTTTTPIAPTTTTPVPPTTTAAPTAPGKTSIERARDFATLCGSLLSFIALAFCGLQYAHYRHLHSAVNHIFMGILLCHFVDNVTYFTCVFVGEQTRKQRCDGCGFIEQLVSFAEPLFQIAFWASMYLIVSGSVIRVKMRFAVFVFALVLPAAVLTACIALAFDMYSSERQSWCWIDSRYGWFRWTFCWSEMWLSVVVAICAVFRPLRYCSTLFPRERSVLFRRATLALVLCVVSIVNFTSRIVHDDTWLTLAAFINPLNGLLSVLSFLWSERMLGLAALGLPPGADPPYGFTAAMHDLPEQVAFVDFLGSRRSEEQITPPTRTISPDASRKSVLPDLSFRRSNYST